MPITVPWFLHLDPMDITLKHSGEKKTVFPVVFFGYPTDGEAGFGLCKHDGIPGDRKDFYYGEGKDCGYYDTALIGPHALIQFWRSIEILRRSTTMTPGYVQLAVLNAASHTPREDDHYVEWVVKKVGREALDKVLAMSPPSALIDKMLELDETIRTEPTCYLDSHHVFAGEIADELRVGTLEWDDRFNAVGAIHPAEIARMEALGEQLPGTYENLIRELEPALSGLFLEEQRSEIDLDYRIKDSLVQLVMHAQDNGQPVCEKHTTALALLSYFWVDPGSMSDAWRWIYEMGMREDESGKKDCSDIEQSLLQQTATWLSVDGDEVSSDQLRVELAEQFPFLQTPSAFLQAAVSETESRA